MVVIIKNKLTINRQEQIDEAANMLANILAIQAKYKRAVKNKKNIEINHEKSN